MIKKSGFVDGMSRDGKRFKIGAEWFSAFAATQVAGVTTGDYVSFTYTEKPSPTGDVYRNIKGNVSKATPPADAPMTAAGVTSSGEKKYTDSRGFVVKEFPVPAFHPDRSIIRQNSLGHAVEVVRGAPVAFSSPQEFATEVIEVARIFEAYSSGDLDIAIVEEEMRNLTATEGV